MPNDVWQWSEESCNSALTTFLLVNRNYYFCRNITIDMNFWKNIFLLFVAPQLGWQEIGKYNVPKDALLSKMFFPMLAVLALSNVASFFYLSGTSISSFLQKVIVDVGVYFFGYMLSTYLLVMINSKHIDNDKKKLNDVYQFVIYSYAMLMALTIVENLLPDNLIDVFIILPLYLVYVIWRGYGFIAPKMSEQHFVLTFALSIMAPYLLLSKMLELLIV